VKASCTDWCNNCSNSWCTKLVKDSTNVTVPAPVYKVDEVARESVSTGSSNIASHLLMSLINDQHICNDICRYIGTTKVIYICLAHYIRVIHFPICTYINTNLPRQIFFKSFSKSCQNGDLRYMFINDHPQYYYSFFKLAAMQLSSEQFFPKNGDIFVCRSLYSKGVN
jgi:hypothetical protein